MVNGLTEKLSCRILKFKRKKIDLKIFKYKNKKEKKALIYSALISIIIGQIVALLAWYIFNENIFIPMIFGSTAGFLVGYRGLNNK